MTTVPETKVVAAEVREASKEKRSGREIWGLKLKVPFSQYPIPTSMPLTGSRTVMRSVGSRAGLPRLGLALGLFASYVGVTFITVICCPQLIFASLRALRGNGFFFRRDRGTPVGP